MERPGAVGAGAGPAGGCGTRGTGTRAAATRRGGAGERRRRRGVRTARVALAGGGLAAAVAATLAVILSGGTQTPDDRPAGSAGPPVVGCGGKECEGADPLVMMCGQQGLATSVLTRTAPRGQRLEIRHSAECGALWARGMNLRAGDRIELSLPGARTKHVVARNPDTYVATPMTAAPDARRARVCLVPAAGGERVCFGPVGGGPLDERTGGRGSG
ncbi:DUF2690 domain-containing protein [Streptomyces sp. G45]|uniref:DUF2690 domain-containing protein n=1 Tax=Streptomyces sp. G45 TaxID=3406627 RepID=UPI003C1C4157